MSDRKAIDEALEELDQMKDERTLDEALDEIDRWKEKASEARAGLSPAELVEYYREVEARFEKLLGEPLRKAV